MNSEEVLKYYLWSMTRLVWYKGSGRWCHEFKKAKCYNRKCDASNAVTNYRDGNYNKNGHKEIFQLHVYKLQFFKNEPVDSYDVKKEQKYQKERSIILKNIEINQTLEYAQSIVNNEVNRLKEKLKRLDKSYEKR